MDARLHSVSFVVGLVLVAALGVAETTRRTTVLRALEEENRTLQRQIDEHRAAVATPAVNGELLRRRVDSARRLTLRNEPTAGLPAALALELPPTAWWTSLSVLGGRLELEGEGAGPEVAAEVLEGVRSVPCLADVGLGGVRRVKHGDQVTHAFRIGARVVVDSEDGPCTMEGFPHTGRDPFLSAGMAEARRRRVSLPPLRRFPLSELRLVGIVDGGTASGGSALIRTPDGEEHPVMVGSGVGDGRARITQILGDMVLLSEDVVTDRETGAVRTRAFTLPLAPSGSP